MAKGRRKNQSYPSFEEYGEDNETRRYDEYGEFEEVEAFEDPEETGEDERAYRWYEEDGQDGRRARLNRRRAARERRRIQLRRRMLLLFVLAALAVVVLIFVVPAVVEKSEDGEALTGLAKEEDFSVSAKENSQTQTSPEQGDGETGTQESEEAEGTSGEEENAAAVLYSYYESDNTLFLSDSLTDISIYDAQRHISATDSEEVIYADSPDAADAEEESSSSATDEDYIDSQYVILVDVDTGEILAERNAFEQIIPASMTKVMTLLVAVEAMDDYEAQLEDTFTITQEITDAAYLSGSSFVGYGVDDVATVEDLLYGTILPSGADAAMALAEYTAGSQDLFVSMMNEKAQELGLSATTHFSNVIGLYDDGNNYSTPYDMCVIMNAAIDNEFCREILSARTWTTQPIMDNPDGTTISNWFLRRAEDHIDDWEILCGKTGYVNESGNCAVSYLQNTAGENYIACTALTYSSWRCIYDHAAIYNCYLKGSTDGD